MASFALDHWQNARMDRLRGFEAHYRPSGAGSVVDDESLQAFVMLLSGHFQGYCRDLYTECTQVCMTTVPVSLRSTVQHQFAAELRLNTANPTLENIRKDFERFDTPVNLGRAAPATPIMVTHLGHLNYWRNAAAHQKSTPAPAGIPASLSWTDARNWWQSCDGLATELDGTMRDGLRRIVGFAPW